MSTNPAKHPKEGSCPLCNAELVLDEKERTGKVKVKCAECGEKYGVDKMQFHNVQIKIYPKEGKCPLCNVDLVLNKKEQAGIVKVKCAECGEKYGIDKIEFPTTMKIWNKINRTPAVVIIVIVLLLCVITFCGMVMATSPIDKTDNDEVKNKTEIISETINEVKSTKVPTPTILVEESWEYVKVASVTDGDTIRIMYNGVEEKSRLLAIEAPELSHPTEPIGCYAKEAKSYLEQILVGQEVHIEFDTKQGERDRYDRLLIYVWIKTKGEDIFLNEHLVKEGYTSVYIDLPSDYKEKFIEIENEAKEAKKGIWSDACACDQYEEINRSCSECNESEVVFSNWDCSERVEIVPDSSCAYLCPVPTKAAYIPSYTCSCSKTCGQMSSCQEAYFQLNTCGCRARDGDGDGIPCESICN